ncbi:serine/threonine-protein kinase Nek7 [Halyomorpha halys]|uniref:serine/threonine-protein kinase Nek7 n=1 Tax=Halyomorpha halys TaxID=286706 RepID=UPI0006D4EBED|nr:serine/threonine-protein kinase Nek7 [Halyomorpha halys]
MYEVEAVIGRGQFSVVCRARDPEGKRVALKKIHLPSMSSPTATADCLKEITLLQQLDHPNIIRYISSFVEGEELNIVLELADAGDLGRMIRHFRRQRRLIPEPTIWKYFVQVASGIHHMHLKRIMHRDIKPANVFVSRGGVVKLGDLGLSRYFSARTLAARSLVGTPYYMSPERLHELPYTFTSDIWSLGCLIYEMAALQSPFYEHRLNLYSLTKKIERGDYPPLPSPIFSEKMRRLIDECLQPNQEDRPDISHVYNVALDMSARQYNVSASYL